MNYRHAYHAGNHADVLKHMVLTLVLDRLSDKPRPWRLLDTHAGAGCYDLSGAEATATGEAAGGILRLERGRDRLPALARWFGALDRLNNDGPWRRYPGSPLLAALLARPGDAVDACELHGEEADTLTAHLAGRPDCHVHRRNGWEAAGALVPPPERRGAVLIDPAFERPGDAARLTGAFATVLRRWPAAVVIGWYPAVRRAEADAIRTAVRDLDVSASLAVELAVSPPGGRGMAASGVVIANCPWQVDDTIDAVLPAIADLLNADPRGTGLTRLVPRR